MMDDMALFLWFVLQVPVLSAIAAATLFTVVFVIASYANFLFKRRA